MAAPRNAAARLALFGLALAMAACTLEPAYQRPPAPVASAYPGADKITGTDADNIGWRSVFIDPRLQALIALALENNRDLRVAILNVEAAQAQYRVARAALLPTLDGIASAKRSRTPADLSSFQRSSIGNTGDIVASAAWEIDLFGKNRSLSRAAIDRYLATDEARKAAQISLVAAVADQYLTLLAYDEQLAVTRATVQTATDSLALARAQFNAGNQTALDLSEAETVLDQAQANLAAQTRLRAEAEDALVLLLGTPMPTTLPAALPFGRQSQLAEIPAGLPSDLLERRPDIRAAEDTLKAANADIGAARAAFFPSISLTGEYGTASSRLAGLFSANRAVWSFGPSVDIPVFAGGTNLANLAAAKAQKAISVAQYEKSVQSAFREVADGLAARATYLDEVAALTRDEQAQKTRLDLSTLRYRTGVDSYLPVLTAQNDLYAVQTNLITTRLARATNQVDLYRALGGGWKD